MDIPAPEARYAAVIFKVGAESVNGVENDFEDGAQSRTVNLKSLNANFDCFEKTKTLRELPETMTFGGLIMPWQLIVPVIVPTLEFGCYISKNPTKALPLGIGKAVFSFHLTSRDEKLARIATPLLVYEKITEAYTASFFTTLPGDYYLEAVLVQQADTILTSVNALYAFPTQNQQLNVQVSNSPLFLRSTGNSSVGESLIQIPTSQPICSTSTSGSLPGRWLRCYSPLVKKFFPYLKPCKSDYTPYPPSPTSSICLNEMVWVPYYCQYNQYTKEEVQSCFHARGIKNYAGGFGQSHRELLQRLLKKLSNTKSDRVETCSLEAEADNGSLGQSKKCVVSKFQVPQQPVNSDNSLFGRNNEVESSSPLTFLHVQNLTLAQLTDLELEKSDLLFLTTGHTPQQQLSTVYWDEFDSLVLQLADQMYTVFRNKKWYSILHIPAPVSPIRCESTYRRLFFISPIASFASFPEDNPNSIPVLTNIRISNYVRYVKEI